MQRPSSPLSVATVEHLRTDICVVGAGLVGQALALALGQTGLRVVLVDRNADLRAMTPPARDFRTYILSPASWQLLTGLGLWPGLQDHAFPIRQILVADDNGGDYVRGPILRFSERETGGRPLAHVIPHHALASGLWRAIDTCPQIVLRTGAQLTEIDRSGAATQALFGPTLCVEAPLIAGCDGKQSKTRDCLGLPHNLTALGQVALTSFVRHAKRNDGIAVQFLSPEGSVTLLPVGSELSSVTVIGRLGLSRTILTDPASRIYKLLLQHLGTFEVDSRHASFPLATGVARRFTDQNVVLLGEAAHVFHPVTGQGLNYGFRDVTNLATAFRLDTWRPDPGGLRRAVARYGRVRRFDALVMAQFSNAMLAMFSSRNILTGLARRSIVRSLNKLPAVRSFLVRKAGGTLPADLNRSRALK